MILINPREEKRWHYICAECSCTINEICVEVDTKEYSEYATYICKDCIDKMYAFIHQPKEGETL